MKLQPIVRSTLILDNTRTENPSAGRNADVQSSASIADKKTNVFLQKLPIELVFLISKYLSPYDWVSFTMTCKGLYKSRNEYWIQDSKNTSGNMEEIHYFLNKQYNEKNIKEKHYFLHALQESVFKKTIRQDVHIPSLVQLFEKQCDLRELEDLYKPPINLLQEEVLSNTDLKPWHIDYLLSNSGLLILSLEGAVNLEALSKISKSFIDRVRVIKAIRMEQEEVLLNMKASGLFINAIDRFYAYCRTPMHIAAASNNLQAVEKLLELGAQPSLTIKDSQGLTPLEVAIEEGHGEVANRLRQVCQEYTGTSNAKSD